MGTNCGSIFIYIRVAPTTGSDKPQQQEWQLAKEVQIKHKAPIVFIRIVDTSPRCTPITEVQGGVDIDGKQYSHRALICSEEQFKLFSLPNFKALHKFKLTAHEGARIRKIELAHYSPKSSLDSGSVTDPGGEYSLTFLTNQGDVNVFTVTDLKRKFQQAHLIKREDINGISSLVFTSNGEAFFLKSSSEYQRISLSASNVHRAECFLQLPELPAIVTLNKEHDPLKETCLDDEINEENDQELNNNNHEDNENEKNEKKDNEKDVAEVSMGTISTVTLNESNLTTVSGICGSSQCDTTTSTLNTTVDSVIDHQITGPLTNGVGEVSNDTTRLETTSNT